MPQMMPINWLISFMFFLIIFILFNIMNYYIIFNKNNKIYNLMNQKKNNYMYKW